MRRDFDRVFWVSAALFVLFSALAGTGILYGLDLRVIQLSQAFTSEALDDLGGVVSFTGDVEVVSAAYVILCVAVFFSGRRLLAVRLLAAYAVAGLMELAMKFLLPVPPLPNEIGRTTDPSPIVEVAYPYPYPSGHMLRTAFLLGVVFVMWPNRLARAAIVVFLALVAATRVYLGVHWLSDLIGGALLAVAGIAWAFRSKRA